MVDDAGVNGLIGENFLETMKQLGIFHAGETAFFPEQHRDIKVAVGMPLAGQGRSKKQNQTNLMPLGYPV